MKINWGTGIAMVYAVFAIAMILFVVKASQQHYDLVNANYYSQAVNYQEKIDARHNAALNKSGLIISYSKADHSIHMNVSGDVKMLSGKLSFYKPDKASDDFILDFTTDASGKKALPVNNLSPGWWNVSATWNVNGKNCLQDERLFIDKP